MRRHGEERNVRYRVRGLRKMVFYISVDEVVEAENEEEAEAAGSEDLVPILQY